MKKRGFTLIEMAIVLVILGLIIGIGIPMFKMLMQQNRLTETRNAVKKAKSSILGYVMTHYCIPRPEWKSVAGKRRRTLPNGFGVKDAQGFDLIYDVDDSLSKIECSYGSYKDKTTFCSVINSLATANHKLYIESGAPYAFVVVSVGLNYRFDAANDLASTLSDYSKRVYENPYHEYSKSQDDVVDGYSIDEFVNLVKNKLGMCNEASSGGSSAASTTKGKLLSALSNFVDEFSDSSKAPDPSDVNLPPGFTYDKKGKRKATISYNGETAKVFWSKRGIRRIVVR